MGAGPRSQRALFVSSDSTMIKKEQEEIKRMKEKQTKEIQMMIEYELKLEDIREENLLKAEAVKAREKEL